MKQCAKYFIYDSTVDVCKLHVGVLLLGDADADADAVDGFGECAVEFRCGWLLCRACKICNMLGVVRRRRRARGLFEEFVRDGFVYDACARVRVVVEL